MQTDQHPTAVEVFPRRSVLALSPYRPPEEGRGDKIRLDFNENTTGFPAALQGEGGLPQGNWTLYPEYGAFLAQLAQAWGVDAESLLLTNGSDEGISVVCTTFIEPGEDRAIVSQPTFDMIPHYLKLLGAQVVEVPVTPALAFDTEAMEAALETGAKLLMLPSPDNPTGAVLSPDLLSAWCRRYPWTLFVLDEAYAEYAGQSVLPLVAQHPNLVVLRTFSKAWGLAGLRLGVVIAQPVVIDYLRRVRSPYSVNAAAIQAAARLLPAIETVHAEAQATMARKKSLMQALEAQGYGIHAGAANFFLLGAGFPVGALCDAVKDRGILVRNRSHLPGLAGRIRVSTGTQEENQAFLDAVAAFRQGYGVLFDLDDTLVDTSQSFDVTVMRLVEGYSGEPLSREELVALRTEGGYNDDWDATVALLQRRGLDISRRIIEEEGKALYLSLARQNERLLVDLSLLERLGRRYRLFIMTGRTRDEYEPIWGVVFNSLFEGVYCRDDFRDAAGEPLPGKPAPDIFHAIFQETGLTGGVYIGNSVDDMTAATAAGLVAIGVTTTQPEAKLRQHGAQAILTQPDDIREVFLL